MKFFNEPSDTNKGARDLYDLVKDNLIDELFKSMYAYIIDEGDASEYPLNEEIKSILITVCQYVYDNKDKVKEILDR